MRIKEASHNLALQGLGSLAGTCYWLRDPKPRLRQPKLRPPATGDPALEGTLKKDGQGARRYFLPSVCPLSFAMFPLSFRAISWSRRSLSLSLFLSFGKPLSYETPSHWGHIAGTRPKGMAGIALYHLNYLAMGQNPVPPVNTPLPTKID